MERLNMYETDSSKWLLPERYHDTYMQAVGYVNEALYNKDFVSRVYDVKEFDLSSDLQLPDTIDVNRDGVVSGTELIAILREGLKTLHNTNLKMVNPGWFSGGWIGKAYPSDMKTTVLSSKYINRTVPRVANTLGHEYCHHVDHLFGKGYYQIGHGSNSVKNNAAPYKFGSIIEDWVLELITGSEPQCKRVVCTGWWIFKRCRTLRCDS